MFTSALAVVISLLIDRRVQAVATVAMALIASAVLGSHDVSAGRSVIPGGCYGCR